MKTPATYLSKKEKILFDLEVCRARIEIRDYFLGTTITDVYDHVGQALSTVNFNLAAEELKKDKASLQLLGATRDLVGKSISDLRQMTKRLHPDNEILKEGGLVWALEYTSTFLGWPIRIGRKKQLIEAVINDGIKLITFKLLLDVLLSIKKENRSVQQFKIDCKHKRVFYSIDLKEQELKKGFTNLNCFAAIVPLLNIIDATYHLRTTNTNTIIISVPDNIQFYE